MDLQTLLGRLNRLILIGCLALCVGVGTAGTAITAEIGLPTKVPPLTPIVGPIIRPIIPVVPIQPLCYSNLPDPQVSLIGTESYSVGGNDFVRYFLSVTNRDQFPDALFAAAPNLDPCGLNTNAARSWAWIVDQDDNYVYGFCALSSAEDLDGLWFAVPDGDLPPAGVRVLIWDRLCQNDPSAAWRSELVPIQPDKFADPPLGDLEVKSAYDPTPPVIDGNAAGGEWHGAGSLPLYDTNGLQRGWLYVKNDDTALYFLVDTTMDTQANPAANADYSGIAFDIGLDGFKSPYVDLKYGTATGTENLGIQYVVSEVGWTGVSPTALSEYMEGFGATPGAATNHKFYEYKIDYGEVDIDFEDVLADPAQPYHARINIKAVSSAPAFSIFYPSSQYGSWENPMIRVSLDIGSLAVPSNAPIIAGIGLVPRTFIDQSNGLATTGPGHQINVTDAPFGAHLRVIGNLDRLRNLGINYYTIWYCNMDLNNCGDLLSGSFDFTEWKFVEDARTNYYWDGMQNRYVLDSVSPQEIYNAGGIVVKAYPMPSAAKSWYFPNLLFDWRTTSTVPVNSGKYKVYLFGFTGPSLGSFVLTPVNESTLVVRIDNTRPAMAINAISYKGSEVNACAMVQLDNATDSLSFNVSAYDPDGFMRNFILQGFYGDNQSVTCAAQTYAGYLGAGGTGPEWKGAFPNAVFTCNGNTGPGSNEWATCGYTFRISGRDRAINGYGRIHWSAARKTITILRPGFSMP